MVVLEEGGMLTTGHNQYLQPDYLSPLPTTVSIKDILLHFFHLSFSVGCVSILAKNVVKRKEITPKMKINV